MVDSTWRMADTRRYALNPQLDITKIVQEAKSRWLRPGEICEIIRNYQRFQLTPDPPYKPEGGSLFLFDRKALRYFRKDGHNWRKKKDGKTVREAHEKLKCGSVDVLHCYYAHGENNENFQRRSYWMLDGNLEHIVLVHYRDINEPSRSSISPHTLTPDQNRINQRVQQTEPSMFAQASSNPNLSSFQSQQSSPIFEEDSGEDLGTPAPSLVEGPAEFNFVPLPGENSPLFKERFTALPTSIQNLYTDHLMSNQVSFQDLILCSEQQNTSNVSKVPFSQLATVKSEWADIETGEQSNSLIPFETDLQKRAEDISRGEIFTLPTAVQPVFIGDSERRGDQMRKKNLASHQHHTETSIEALYQLGTQTKQLEERQKDLNRLDSFGRWMSKEIGKDCDDSIMAATASDSCNYWNTLEGSAQAEAKEVISRHIMQLDSDVSLGPSVSQDQLFSIVDFSPDWAYTNVETKVLISGKFLGTADLKTIKWGCMFGGTEVPAEVLTSSGGAIRCFAPPCSKVGRVPFYVTSSNRLACSEIREFEFRATPAPASQCPLVDPEKEYHLQVRLANLLSVGPIQRAPAVCLVQNCTKCELWRCLIKEFGEISTSNKSFGNGLIERLMLDRLIKWLGCKLHGEDEIRMVHVLDGDGQGIIHLTGALGYDWALGPIVASGISPNFRDARGWTALHWAASCGREETVVALVNIGADPAAVEDPTSKSPGGRTAADVASSRGHKGIAGFLAEAHLTSHLSSLNLKEGTISDNLDFPECALTCEEETDNLSLKGSLAALRNSVQAAAKIHTAFRVSSFRQREMREKEKREGVDALDSVAVVSSMGNRLKLGSAARSNSEPLHSGAAVKIQQKYRGWKGRKEFLKIRDKIVKIQAHVRGHQVRNQYKRVVWSVSIVEKAVLRWRRKGAGLRGFRAMKTITDVTLNGSGSSDEYDYLSLGRRQKEAGIERALSRVRSMVRSSEGRDQYMRLANSSRKAKFGDGGSLSSQFVKTEQVETLDHHSPMIQ